LLEAQKALDDAVAANPNDQTTISADAAALGSALGQLAVARAEVEAQVSAIILTAAQEQKLVEERQRLDDRLTKLIQRLSASS
jgi:Spy/CpxP family protein refolding chaperone